jgi:hypothetical protein
LAAPRFLRRSAHILDHPFWYSDPTEGRVVSNRFDFDPFTFPLEAVESDDRFLCSVVEWQMNEDSKRTVSGVRKKLGSPKTTKSQKSDETVLKIVSTHAPPSLPPSEN